MGRKNSSWKTKEFFKENSTHYALQSMANGIEE